MLPNSRLHEQMLALARIERRRRARNWFNGMYVAILLFFADQILKTWCLRQLAPGDQVEFFGQHSFVLTHLHTAVASGTVLNLMEWSLWAMVAVILVLRASEARFLEIVSSCVLLVAGLSNLLTRWMLDTGLNVFAIQWAPATPLVSFNLAHLAIAISAFCLSTAWLRALWPESLAENRQIRV